MYFQQACHIPDIADKKQWKIDKCIIAPEEIPLCMQNDTPTHSEKGPSKEKSNFHTAQKSSVPLRHTLWNDRWHVDVSIEKWPTEDSTACKLEDLVSWCSNFCLTKPLLSKPKGVSILEISLIF